MARRFLARSKFALLWICVFVQGVSICISIFGEWFQRDRLYPILHNLLVFILFVMAVYQGRYTDSPDKLKPIFVFLLVCLFLGSLGSIVLYQIGYPPFIDGVFSPVQFYRIGYASFGHFPRTVMFGSYPNATAILAFSLFVLITFRMEYDYPEKKAIGLGVTCMYLMTLFVVMLSGSRIVLVALLCLPLLYVLRKQSSRITLAGLAIPLLGAVLYFGVIESIMQLRPDSTMTRLGIYSKSMEYLQQYNLLLGLGIKPKLEEFGNVPLASHSTYLGYFVKNGIVGGILCILILLYVFFRFSLAFIQRSHCSDYIRWGALCFFLLIWAFEDLDAYEPNAILFGFFVGMVFRGAPLLRAQGYASFDKKAGAGHVRLSSL